MCNAEVSWMACRASDTREGLGEGPRGARAVRVAAGVLVGRVLYRGAHLVGAVLAPACHCHVIIYGRPFAFNCYELLVLAEWLWPGLGFGCQIICEFLLWRRWLLLKFLYFFYGVFRWNFGNNGLTLLVNIKCKVDRFRIIREYKLFLN